MKAGYVLLFISLIFLPVSSFAQREVQGITYHHQIFEQLLDSTDSRPFILSNRTLKVHPEYNTTTKLSRFLIAKFGKRITDSLNRIRIHRDLALKDCHIEGNFELYDVVFERSVNIYNCTFNDLVLKGDFDIVNLGNNTMHSIRLMDASFRSRVAIEENTTDFIRISQSDFSGPVYLRNNSLVSELRLASNTFNSGTGFICDELPDSLTYGREFEYTSQLDIKGLGSHAVTLDENVFLSSNGKARVHIRGTLGDLVLEDNIFQSLIDLTALAIDNRFVMTHNTLQSNIAFNDLIFPELFNLLRWDQIQGYRILVLEKKRTSETDFWNGIVECNPSMLTMEDKEEQISVVYKGENVLELANADAFEKLIYSYKSLYSIYNSRGDLESANACYAEMKEVQRRRLKYIYETEGGFANYFRWQLLVLLKVYTNHGTDPALALVISVYVIFFFAVFYFFFPSEWDVTSKGKLVNDFKDFIQKNDKGYFKPFLTVVLGFVLSLINAFTLSLNSFVTLGFGNIPAKGLARYICVLEGFIGWFLLSIFTVALINQVLA